MRKDTRRLLVSLVLVGAVALAVLPAGIQAARALNASSTYTPECGSGIGMTAPVNGVSFGSGFDGGNITGAFNVQALGCAQSMQWHLNYALQTTTGVVGGTGTVTCNPCTVAGVTGGVTFNVGLSGQGSLVTCGQPFPCLSLTALSGTWSISGATGPLAGLTGSGGWTENTPFQNRFLTGTILRTAPTGSPFYELRNRASVRCLDADKATLAANGTKVQLWDCHQGANQDWAVQTDGTIVNQASGRCLNAEPGNLYGNGTTVDLWDCNGGPNQQWTVNADGTIQHRASGRTLDADGGSININGTKVQLWDANGGRNQSWYRASQQNLPTVNSYTNCQAIQSHPLTSDIQDFKPCMTTTDAFDGTSVATRAITPPATEPQSSAASCSALGHIELFSVTACQVSATGSFWNGAGNVDYVDMGVQWQTTIAIPVEGVPPQNSCETDNYRMEVVTMPDGTRTTNLILLTQPIVINDLCPGL